MLMKENGKENGRGVFSKAFKPFTTDQTLFDCQLKEVNNSNSTMKKIIIIKIK